MATKNVLVTGIGGNVGQGIIRNIKATSYDIKITGTNVTDFSAGNYLCDVFYKVPFAYENNYISTIIDIVTREKIDLIIPSTDYEVFYLASHKSNIPCVVAASAPEAAAVFLDKYKTWEHHKQHGIPFAESVLPSQYKNVFKEYILKPREGRGSRGLSVNPKDISVFKDEEYMVQEMHIGEEITTAFYVSKQKKLNGFITMSRTLDNGMTNLCKVITTYDQAILPILQKMIACFDIKGSLNLQSIVTSSGNIIPFEVNCRISGTNSIRSNFGFKDVQYTLQEFLYNQTPDEPKIIPGVAVRVLLDVIYPGQDSYENIKDNSSEHYIF